MKLNRNEVKKIIYDFNSIASRLMRAHFRDYNHILARFLGFIDTTEIIKEFVNDCGHPTFDVAEAYKRLVSHHTIFNLGETDQHEIANIYGVLKYLREHEADIDIRNLGFVYGQSSKFQDAIKMFNERVTMVLIRHIEGYLTKIGIDMGMDINAKYTITVNNGQVNLASDNAVINATQNNGLRADELTKLIQHIKGQVGTLSEKDKITVDESLEVIENESKLEKPKKSMIKTALNTIQSIKGTTEFCAAVTTLVQFFQPLFQ